MIDDATKLTIQNFTVVLNSGQVATLQLPLPIDSDTFDYMVDQILFMKRGLVSKSQESGEIITLTSELEQ